MGCAANVQNNISELFDASQFTSAVHQKNGIILRNIYEKTDHKTFFEALKHSINAILFTDFKQRNVFVEKAVNFFASYCALFKPIYKGDEIWDHVLLTDVIDYLLEASECERDVVRFRSCQIINKILDHLVGTEVSSDLSEKLKNVMLSRLEDPKTVIRLQVILTLYRLQDPSDPEDDIISKFVVMMKTDPFAKIRHCCVQKVAVRKDVIPAIIERIRDTDVGVRLEAYKRLTKFAEYLKISSRRQILSCGAVDSSDKVKDFINSTLINSWLENYDNDILQLMKSVRLDANEKDIQETVRHYEFILSAVFNQKNLKSLSEVLRFNEHKLLEEVDLNWETIAYWRIYMQYLFDKDFEEELEIVQPEFFDLCIFIKQFYSNIPFGLTTEQFFESQFIIKQFFLMTKTYDMSDPARCQYLNSLVRDILIKVELMFDVTQIVVTNLNYTMSKLTSRCSFVCEIISEIIYPTDSDEEQKKEEERELAIAKLEVKLNCFIDEQNNAVKNGEYMEAERLKHEIVRAKTELTNLKSTRNQQEQVEKRTDIPTVVKYLDIACSLLHSQDVTELIPSLKSLKNNIIQELLIHDNDAVRAKALHCYGLCCLVDKTDARTGIHIFSTPILAYSAGEECDTQTLSTCIAAVVDLLRIYGSDLLAEPTEGSSDSMDEAQEKIFSGGTSLTDIIRGLVELLNDEEYEIQQQAGMGLCKLILSERFHSSTLVARLILKWCTPISDDTQPNGLKQMIGYTLQQIPALPNGADQLRDAVLVVIKALVFAPDNSPLHDVNVENISKFMLALCASSREGREIHASLAFKICSEMDGKKGKLNVIYSKVLLMLEIGEDEMTQRDLLNLCDIIRDKVAEKNAVKNVIKFMARINEKCNKITDIVEENGDVDMEEDRLETNSVAM